MRARLLSDRSDLPFLLPARQVLIASIEVTLVSIEYFHLTLPSFGDFFAVWTMLASTTADGFDGVSVPCIRPSS